MKRSFPGSSRRPSQPEGTACATLADKRAKHVLSRPGGSGTAVVVFVYLLLGWVFPQPPEGETRSALSAAEASLMFVTGRALLGGHRGMGWGE